jgi:formamidopyrimidine-DNA glycosylase
MPELPEVETMRRALEPVLLGRVMVEVQVLTKRLRRPVPRQLASRMRGLRVVATERRAKYILLHLDSGQTLVVHLGMTGGFHVATADGQRPSHTHMVIKTDRGVTLWFIDPRRFGSLDFIATDDWQDHALFRDLGPEPLEPRFHGRVLAARLAGKKTPIKQALLDQRVVAGIGNIYASEALFYARIHPHTLAGAVDLDACASLARAIKKVLRAAIAVGGSSLRDYRHLDGSLGFFQDRFAVYDRAGSACPGCRCGLKTGGIAHSVMGGRATYWCPFYQGQNKSA